MSKKISELPAAPDYTVTDFLPIVDAETNMTQKLYISQLVTASYGLSASFVTLGDTTTGAPPTTGLVRVPNSNGYINVVEWNKNGSDFPLLRTDGVAANWLIGSLGSAYGHMYAYTLNLDGWTTFTVSNAGATAFTTAPTVGTTFATPVTASIGVSASHVAVGPNQYGGLAGQGVYKALKTWDYLTASVTTSTTPVQAFTFSNATANKTYVVNLVITATSTTTTGSGYWNWDGHWFMSGSVMQAVNMTPSMNKQSRNSTSIATSLTSSAGNIVCWVTGSTETYNWGVSARVQET